MEMGLIQPEHQVGPQIDERNQEKSIILLMYSIGSSILEKAKELQIEVKDTPIFRGFLGFWILREFSTMNLKLSIRRKDIPNIEDVD